jgi:phosphate transport system permease protein
MTVAAAPAMPDAPRSVRPERTRADKVYRAVATAGGLMTLVVLFMIGLFLFLRSASTFRQYGFSFFTTSTWNPSGGQAGVAAVLYGTFEVAIIALVEAVPIALLAALFLTEYASPRARGPLTTVVDLLAAIPSLIYGIWGFFVLQPHVMNLSAWLTAHFGFIPIFSTTGPFFGLSPFLAGTLVGLMLLPTATSVMREVFAQTPPGEKEAALALGGSRWRMIRTVVIPFGRGGIVGGSMLALGRAMGESISVALVFGSSFAISVHMLQTGGTTIGANIVNRFGDASPADGSLQALLASGLVLFIVTLIVNVLASLIVRRSRSGQGVEI